MTTETTRRRIVAGTAAALASGAAVVLTIDTAASTELDPVLVAIDEHRRLHAILLAAGKSEPNVGHPELPAWEEERDEACNAEHRAAWELVNSVPTTAAGARAFAEYVPAILIKEHWNFAEPALVTLAATVKDLIGRGE